MQVTRYIWEHHAVRNLKHWISHLNIALQLTKHWTKDREKNLFIQNIRHNDKQAHVKWTILKNWPLPLKYKNFCYFFLVNTDWKYFQNITCKTYHVASPCYGFMLWAISLFTVIWVLPFIDWACWVKCIHESAKAAQRLRAADNLNYCGVPDADSP